MKSVYYTFIRSYLHVRPIQVSRDGSLAIGPDSSLSANVSEIYVYVLTISSTSYKGQVLYRQSNNSNEFARTAATIQSAFDVSGNFTPSFLFISTWLDTGMNSQNVVCSCVEVVCLTLTFNEYM